MSNRFSNTLLVALFGAALSTTRPASAEPQNERATVSVSLGWRGDGTQSDVSAGARLSLPWDEWLAHSDPPRGPGERNSKHAPVSDKHATTERTNLLPVAAERAPHATSTTSTSAPPSVHERTLARWLNLRGEDASAALAAGMDREGFALVALELGDLRQRARRSAALPQLRLRAMRLTNESAAMMPTSYDPFRQTISGGASLWLEARATWNLDRAVFAPEELRIATLERELRATKERAERRILDTLYGWQAAVAERLDPSASFRECRLAHIKELQLGAELERLTGGWFTRFRAERPPLPEADCIAVAERVER